MSIEKTSVPLLEGSSNYPIQALKMRSYLIRKGRDKALEWEVPISATQIEKSKKAQSDIVLHCKTKPAFHIEHDEFAFASQEKFKTLYKEKGFVLKFLLGKAFFNAKPKDFKSVEKYLNEVKRLTGELKVLNLEIPQEIVISWILHNLSEEFEAFTASITQSFRSNENAYSIDTLIAAIIDEAKRHKHRNQANTASLEPRKGKGGKKNSRVGKNSSWKKEKGQLYKICKKPSYKS